MAGPWWAALGGDRLFASGFGMWGGGLYELVSDRVDAVDDLATVGLAVGGGAVHRVLRAPGEFTGCGEVLRYDERGVRRYLRLDEVRDPHDACWHDGALHLVGSWDSTVWRVRDESDRAEPVWRGGAVVDSWHANCLVAHDGRLHLSAFGRGDRHKAFGGDDAVAAGFVVDLDGGRDVVTGLAQPHTPRPLDGGWLVCESGARRLTHVLADGTRRHLALDRYTRGLAVVDRWAFVGLNAPRAAGEAAVVQRAEVVVVDLASWEVVDRVGLPCLEVYDVVAVPGALADGLRAGFATNAFRVGEQRQRPARPADQRPTPATASLPLATPAQADAVAGSGAAQQLTTLAGAVDAALPASFAAGTHTTVRATVRNDSATTWVTIPPYPLAVTPRWYADGADEPVVGHHTPLPRPLAPGATTEVDVLVEVPDTTGRYRLALTLRQKGVGWFGARSEATVEVV